MNYITIRLYSGKKAVADQIASQYNYNGADGQPAEGLQGIASVTDKLPGPHLQGQVPGKCDHH